MYTRARRPSAQSAGRLTHFTQDEEELQPLGRDDYDPVDVDRIGLWNEGVAAANQEEIQNARRYSAVSVQRRRSAGLTSRFAHVPEMHSHALARELDREDGYSAHESAQFRRSHQGGNRGYMQALREMSQPEDYQRHPTGHRFQEARVEEPRERDQREPEEKEKNVRFDTAPEREKQTHSNNKGPTGSKMPSIFRLVALEVQDKSREQELRRRDLALTFSSLFGLFTMVLGAIVTWYSNPERESGLDGVAAPYYQDLDPSPTGKVVCDTLAIITSLSTLVSLILIARYYALLLEKKRHEWCQQMVPWQKNPQAEHEKHKVYSFWQSWLSWHCFVEMFIHIVHPMPFMDGTSQYVSIRQKTIYSYFQLWMLLRVYLVCRVLHTLHPAYRKRFEILYNNQELQIMNFKVTWSMTMKLYLYGHMWASMLFLTMCLFLIFGFALFIIERVEQPTAFGAMDKTLFYCFTTSATIGYGRVTAITKAGRVVTFVLGCYGQILMTFFTAIITNVLEPTKEEEMIRNYVSSSKAEHKYRVAAAMLIQASWKSSKKYKILRGLVSPNEQKRMQDMWRDIYANRKKKDEDKFSASGRHFIQQALDRDTESMPESSPTQTRSAKDTSSMGRSDGLASGGDRNKRNDLDLFDRADKFGRQSRTNMHTTLRLDATPGGSRSNSPTGAQNGSHPHGYQRKSQFFYDMETVNRLNNRVENSGGSRKKGSGVLGDMLRGITRVDMKETDLPTYKKRILAHQKYPCLPLYAPHHKSNFLFEGLKRFRKRKRELAECRLEAKDGVLELGLEEISSLSVTLSDHVNRHEEDLQVLGDRIHQELRVVREAVEEYVRSTR